jgi:hypothetical protein
VPNSDHRDFVLTNSEDDTVIGNSKSKIPVPLPGQHFDIACAGIAVFGQGVENANGRLALNRSQLVPSGFRPNELQLTPNSRRTSSCATTFPARISSRVRAIAAASESVTGSSSGGAALAARYAGLDAKYSKKR